MFSVFIFSKEEINGVKTKKENFFISAHADVLGDLQFSPFNANKLATGGKDAVVKVIYVLILLIYVVMGDSKQWSRGKHV